MQQKKKETNLYEIDYDGDSWLGKKEVSFSSKLMVAIGGITSFGGLFPIIVDKIAHFKGEYHIDWSVFFIFSLGYFVLPLITFILWVLFTDRVVYPEKRLAFNLKSWKGNHNKFPISFKYFWLVILHTVCVSIYLFFLIRYSGSDHRYWPSIMAILLVIAPLIALSISKIKQSYKIGLWVLVTAVFIILGSFLHTNLYQHKHSKGNVYEDDKLAYEQLIIAEKTAKELDSLEKRIVNRVERFYIKSFAQMQLNKDTVLQIPSYLDVTELTFDAQLKILGQIMLKEKAPKVTIDTSRKEPRKLKFSYPTYAEATQYKLFFTGDKCNNLLDRYEELRKHDLSNKNLGGSGQKTDSLSLLKIMQITDHLINTIMDDGQHRVFPDRIVVAKKSEDDSLLVLNYLDSFSEEIQVKNLKSGNVNTLNIIDLSAKLNFRNSKLLKNWIENVYLPYCQLKAQNDTREVGNKTAWIWEDMQARGLVISLITLILLGLFYMELEALKAKKLAEIKRNTDVRESEEVTELRNKRIDELNAKATYLLFPLTMIITIVSMLIIPITAQTEVSSLAPSRSFLMMNVPSLHLPEVVEQVVSDADDNKDNENSGLGGTDGIPNKDVKLLTEALRELTRKLGSEGERNALEREKKKLQDQIEENRVEIQENEKTIEAYEKDTIPRLKKLIESLQKSRPE